MEKHPNWFIWMPSLPKLYGIFFPAILTGVGYPPLYIFIAMDPNPTPCIYNEKIFLTVYIIASFLGYNFASLIK